VPGQACRFVVVFALPFWVSFLLKKRRALFVVCHFLTGNPRVVFSKISAVKWAPFSFRVQHRHSRCSKSLIHISSLPVRSTYTISGYTLFSFLISSLGSSIFLSFHITSVSSRTQTEPHFYIVLVKIKSLLKQKTNLCAA